MVYLTADCWTGSLPLTTVDTWSKIENVIYFKLHYGKRTIKLCGLDYYYWYEYGYKIIAGGWVSPSQPWSDPSWVGREYVFDRTDLLHSYDLTSVPNVLESKEGYMLPDAIASEIGMI